MIFAHIPSGYVLAHVLIKHRQWPPWLLWVGMIGGTAPDIDLLYSKIVYQETLGHRFFITHYPVAWILFSAICLGILLLLNRRSWLKVWAVFFSTVFLHLGLDTLVGNVYWFAPYDWAPVRVFTIPYTSGMWILDVMRHWTIVFEMAIITSAAGIFAFGGWRDLLAGTFPRNWRSAIGRWKK